MKYRPDIDGLRAIAVIPVVLYHAGVTGFSGGFVGVDVFFVISGYLITRLIWREIQEGRFSIVTFYERRARRILPALFVVMAFSAFAAYRLFLSNDLRDFSNSLVAATAFVANLHFLGAIDYFAAPAEVKPLLHTWSLAIEEQFYIVYPLLLLGLWRFNSGRVVPLLLGGLLLSLGLSVWTVGQNADAAFYLPHTRAWELLLGSLLALGVVPPVRSVRVSAGISTTGLGLILVAVFAYEHSTPFPGLAALLPCLGAAAIIYSGEAGPNAVSRLLCTPVFVGVGLISYSLYLWHWPLIVFAKYYLMRPLVTAEIFTLASASFALAWLSWRYVERPFRGRASPIAKSELARWSTIAVSAFLIFGVLGHQTLGFANRTGFDRYVTPLPSPLKECLSKDSEVRLRNGDLCQLGINRFHRPEFIVWGDSHAEPLFAVIDMLAQRHEMGGVFVNKRGCRPLLGLGRQDAQDKCVKFNAEVFEYIRRKDIRNVLLVGRWNIALGSPQSEAKTIQDVIISQDSRGKEKSFREHFPAFQRALNETFKALADENRKTWYLMQVPYVGLRVPQLLAKNPQIDGDVRLPLENGIARHLEMLRKITPIAAKYEVIVLDPIPILCEGQQCVIAKSDQALYSDDHHLSGHGGLMLEGLLSSVFDGNRSMLTETTKFSSANSQDIWRTEK